jgi:hypothetical protein
MKNKEVLVLYTLGTFAFFGPFNHTKIENIKTVNYLHDEVHPEFLKDPIRELSSVSVTSTVSFITSNKT